MQRLNTFYLKWLATIFMLCDHIAYTCISPSSIWLIPMRCIGRLAAPIFWFCFIEGYKNTRDKKKYAFRLFIASVGMMVGNTVLVYLLQSQNIYLKITPINPNMFFTMSLMLIAITLLNNCIKEVNKLKFCLEFIFAMSVLLFTGLYAEYNWFAVFSILALYFVPQKAIKYILFIIGNIVLSFLQGNPYQSFMVAAVLFFLLYKNEKPQKSMKYFFYIFYPLHLWILMIIGVCIRI